LAAQYFFSAVAVSLAWYAEESGGLIDCNEPGVFIEYLQMCHRRGSRTAAYHFLKTIAQEKGQYGLTLCLTGFVGHTMMAYLTLWRFAIPEFCKGKGYHIVTIGIMQQFGGTTLPCPTWWLCLFGMICCRPIAEDIPNRTSFAIWGAQHEF
jgi:hypothetical protein